MATDQRLVYLKSSYHTETTVNRETRELIEACHRNERLAQSTLYRTYYSEMMKVCMRYTANREDAREMLNMGFLKIFTRLSDYRFEGSFEGWMRRIMVNTAIDQVRSIARREVHEISYDEYQVHESAFAQESVAEHRASSEAILNLINLLPPMTRTVFNLYAVDGYPHADIAEMLGIKEGTSHWHVMNARTLLKEKIGKR